MVGHQNADIADTLQLRDVAPAIIMVALWNRADHYIFALWLLLLFCVLCFQRAAYSRFQTRILNSH